MSRPGPTALRGIFDAEAGPELMCGPPAAVFCCCTHQERRDQIFEFSFWPAELWGFEPWPLACHESLTHSL